MSKKSHQSGTLCLNILIAIVSIVLASGCTRSDPKSLTRDHAQGLIKAHENFSKPYVIRLEGSEKFLVPTESVDESPPDNRAVNLFYQDYPLSGALHHLGLVEAVATVVKRPEVLAFTGSVTSWVYKIETRRTAKGEEQADGVKNGLPLYRREIAEVTGVTVGQTGRARAEFKWRRVPTPVGEALEAEGQTFKSLPAKMQEGIRKSISRFGNALPVSYKGVQNGHAEFQLYDDGWRLDLVQLK
jgi:hypothetical protein